MASYPGTIVSLTNPNGTNLLSGPPDHAALTTSQNNELIAIETFLGTNAGTNLFQGYQAGWQPLAVNGGTLQTVIAKGTLNNSILGTATLQAPTINGLGTNSGTLINGVYNASTLGTPAITGGTITSSLRILGSAAISPGSSATGTLDLSLGNRFLVNLPNNAGSVGVAVKNSAANQPFIIEVLQGTQGNGTVVWFGSINWLNNGTAAPTQGTTPSLKATYGFMTTGAGTYDGYLVGQAS